MNVEANDIFLLGTENVCETAEEDCAVTSWSAWSPCSVTCGNGTSQRLRFYLNKQDMIRCQRDTQQTQMCVADLLDCRDALLSSRSSGIVRDLTLVDIILLILLIILLQIATTVCM